MRTAHNGTMKGTRVGAGPAGEPYGRGFAVAKVVVLYHCANKHQTLVPFIWTVTPPPQWECRICSQPAGTDPLNPPPRVARYMGEKTHLGRVRDRRTQAEGDRLMAESLARREHPEELRQSPARSVTTVRRRSKWLRASSASLVTPLI